MSAASIRVLRLDDAPDANGEGRGGLLVPPAPNATVRRPVLLLFASVALAVQAKRAMEATR